MFTGLHCRASQYKAAYTFVENRRNSHCHGEVSFSCTGRTHADSQVVVLDCVDIAALVDRFRRKNFLSEASGFATFYQAPQRNVLVRRYDPEKIVQVSAVESSTFLYQVNVIGHNLLRPADLILISFQFKEIAFLKVSTESKLRLE